MNGTWPPVSLAEFARALPFEHLLRKRGPIEAMARWSTESQVYALVEARPRIALLMSAGESAHALETLASWSLQTWPDAPWLLVGEERAGWRDALDESGLPQPLAVIADADPATLASFDIDWVVLAQAGDLLHPSLAGIVARHAASGADAVAWDWFDAEREGRMVQPIARRRGPLRDDVAELTEDLRGLAFALPAHVWQGDPARDAWGVRMTLPAAGQDWRVHPEPLGIYSVRRDSSCGDTKIASQVWGSPFEATTSGPQPARAAARVSVVILYRDRIDLTLSAIESVTAQRLPGLLELVLVDNQSSETTKAQMAEHIRQLPPNVSVRMLEYPQAFNHSRQCNLAAQAATGDVLVFLNNDARMLEVDALDRLSRWALLPGVASVGVRMVDADGRTAGGGFRARRLPGAEFNSPVEEAAGPVGDRARLTVGNAFACAAVSTEVFRGLGGLDEIGFPIGYNDVDFCLRATRDGWHHVNVADVKVFHAVGASRPRTDEIAQKLALRLSHPWLAGRALQEIDVEPVALPRVELSLLLSSTATAAGALP